MTKTNSISLNKAEVYPVLTSTVVKTVKGRVEFGGNTTSSVGDEVFDAYRQKALTLSDKTDLKDWDFVLNASKLAIEMHLEKRVSQLFMQAVLCYNSGYRFEEGHTVHQGFGAHNLKIDDKEIKQNAAHHATLPCLYAFSKDAKEGVVFLYRSAFYDESNATVDVVKPVNDADRAIDEKRKDSLLREHTVKLLNLAAEGKLTPPELVEEFIQVMLKEIRKSILAEKDVKVVDVLKIYEEMAEELQFYVKSPESIDRWLDLKIEDPKLFEDDHTKVAYIKRRIGELPLLIHAERHQKHNESHIPAHFYDLFHYQVLSRFKGPELRVVEKAIGRTFKDLESKVKDFKYTKRTNGLIEKHAGKIDSLVKEITPLMAVGSANQNIPENVVSNRKVCLRPSIYRLRYKMISADQKAQSVVKSKLESVLNKVKKESKAHFLEDFFYRSFFDKAQNENMRLMFCKLLNMSGLALDQKIRELKVCEPAHKAIDGCGSQITGLSSKIGKRVKDDAVNKDKIKTKIKYILDQIKSSTTVSHEILQNLYYRRLFDQVNHVKEENLLTELIGQKNQIDLKIKGYQKQTSAEKEIVEQNARVQEVADVAFAEIAKLNAKTAKYQRKLFRELREAHGMKQVQLAEAYSRDNPGPRLINTRISELETGHKKLTSEIMEKVSKVYGISPSLFYPSNFAEVVA